MMVPKFYLILKILWMSVSADPFSPEHLPQSCLEHFLPAINFIIPQQVFNCNQKLKRNVGTFRPLDDIKPSTKLNFPPIKRSSHQKLHQASLHGQPDYSWDVDHQCLLKYAWISFNFLFAWTKFVSHLTDKEYGNPLVVGVVQLLSIVIPFATVALLENL